jgi:hypothetical protein
LRWMVPVKASILAWQSMTSRSSPSIKHSIRSTKKGAVRRLSFFKGSVYSMESASF